MSGSEKRTTAGEGMPGSFAGETVTRRRLMTAAAQLGGAVAVAGIVLPVIGFAVGPVFDQMPVMWQSVGSPETFDMSTWLPVVIRLTPDAIGPAAASTAYIRRRDPAVDTEPEDRWNRFIAVSTRCAHVGCPVHYVNAARSFICPCHGGVYDFRARRVAGPPPRPLDRFLTRVRGGQLQVGPRYSVNSALERFSPRAPGESLDGIGRFLYPPRPSSAPLPDV